MKTYKVRLSAKQIHELKDPAAFSSVLIQNDLREQILTQERTGKDGNEPLRQLIERIVLINDEGSREAIATLVGIAYYRAESPWFKPERFLKNCGFSETRRRLMAANIIKLAVVL